MISNVAAPSLYLFPISNVLMLLSPFCVVSVVYVNIIVHYADLVKHFLFSLWTFCVDFFVVQWYSYKKGQEGVITMTQGERVKEIRKSIGLTLEKFGEPLGVGKTAISNIEKGNRNLTDQMAISICREFNVNETWLRTGEGEMFIELSRDEQIAEFVGRTLSTESESFKKRFIAMLAKLDESDWETLEKIALELAQKKD